MFKILGLLLMLLFEKYVELHSRAAALYIDWGNVIKHFPPKKTVEPKARFSLYKQPESFADLAYMFDDVFK